LLEKFRIADAPETDLDIKDGSCFDMNHDQILVKHERRKGLFMYRELVEGHA
jgi:hypothetical protein